MENQEEVKRVQNSAFMEECHECDNVTRHMWQTRHCVVRACSFECALAFHKGANEANMTLQQMRNGEIGWTDDGREFTVLRKGQTISLVDWADTGRKAVFNDMPVHSDSDEHRAGCAWCQKVHDYQL